MIDKQPFKFAPGNYVKIANHVDYGLLIRSLSRHALVPYIGNFPSDISKGIFKIKRRKFRLDEPYYGLIPINGDFIVQGRTKIDFFSNIYIFSEKNLTPCSNLYSWNDVLKGGK